MTTGDSYREKSEEYDVIQMAIPIKEKLVRSGAARSRAAGASIGH
jgi:hypothetical protein